MTTPILELIDINKILNESFRLSNVGLTLFESRVHMLIGENGSGKSTIMKIIAGLMQPDSGSVILEGMPIQTASFMILRRRGILYIGQNVNLLEQLTVAENVFIEHKPYLNRVMKIIDFNQLYAQCQRVFEELGINIDVHRKVSALGAAQKRLVELARAYVSRPRILLLDEISASFTDVETKILFNVMQKMKNMRVSILYITHKMEEIQKIGDQVSIVKDGRIAGTLEAKNAYDSDVIGLMKGYDHQNRYPKLDVRPGKYMLRVNQITSGGILKDVTFDVRRGEIVGITGLVGSGRSLLAKCLFGLEKIDSGEMIVQNEVVNIKSPAEAIQKGLALITDDRMNEDLFPGLSLKENMMSASMKRVCRFGVIDRRVEKELMADYVDKLSIQAESNLPISCASGGNQQRILLAKWMFSKAKIFILDEPTHGIDTACKVDVYNMMNDLVRKGVSILLISSDMDEILGMSDRILILAGGKISAELSRKDATKEKILYHSCIDEARG